MNVDVEISAYHEAGHAAVAIISGVFTIDGPITYEEGRRAGVDFKPDDTWLLERAHLSSTELDAEINPAFAVVAAAGAQAEFLYRTDAGFSVDEKEIYKGALGDIRAVHDLYGKGKFEEFRSKANDILQRDDVWQAVSNLAAALIQVWPTPFPAEKALPLIVHLKP